MRGWRLALYPLSAFLEGKSCSVRAERERIIKKKYGGIIEILTPRRQHVCQGHRPRPRPRGSGGSGRTLGGIGRGWTSGSSVVAAAAAVVVVVVVVAVVLAGG